MAKEPDNIVHVLLREIRAKQDELSTKLDGLSTKLDAVDSRVRRVEKQIEDLRMTVTYSLGQSTETQFRQTQQGARIDELFAQLEKMMADEKQ